MMSQLSTKVDDDAGETIYWKYPELFFHDYLCLHPKRIINLNRWTQLRPRDLEEMLYHYPESGHHTLAGQGVSAYDELDFGSCVNIDETALLPLLKSTKKSLKVLNLCSCEKAASPAVMKLVMGSFLVLQHLNVKNCSLRDEALETIRHRPRFAEGGKVTVSGLSTLDIEGNELVTDIGVMAMLKSNAADALRELNIAGCHRVTDMAFMTSMQSAAKFENLISLNISRINITSLGIQQLAKVCRNMEHFIAQETLINDPSLEHIGNHMRKIKAFDIAGSTLVSDTGMLALLDYDMDVGDSVEQEMKNIKAKRFKSKADVAKLAKQAASEKGCRSLTSLNVRGCYNIGKDTMVALSRRSPGLTSLDISGLNKVDNRSFVLVSKRCHDLKRIRISGKLNTTSAAAMKEEKASADSDVFEARVSRGTFFGIPNITEAGILEIKSKVLENINVNGCVSMTSKSIQHFVRCGSEHLKILKLSGCKNVTDDALLQVAKGCVNVHILDFTGCELITDMGVAAIAVGCPNLAEVRMKDCWRLTDVGIVSLLSTCSKLTHIDCRENTNLSKSSIDATNEKYQLQYAAFCKYANIDIDHAIKVAKKLPLIKYVSSLGNDIVYVTHDKVILSSLARRALHKRSAKLIQYRFRAWSASRRSLRVKIARAELIYKRRVMASITCQRYFRGKMGRRIAAEQKRLMRTVRKRRRRKAAIEIQCFRRKILACRFVKLLRRGANYFKFKQFRRYCRRIRVLVMQKRNAAAITIQSRWRVYMAKRAFRRALLYRDWQGLNIQRVWHGFKGRVAARLYRKLRTALALSAQRIYRGKLGRKEAANIREVKRQEKERLDQTAVIIQTQYRHQRRRRKWNTLIARVITVRTFVARHMQKCYRGWAGRERGRKWLYKWQFYRPTPILGTPPPIPGSPYETLHIFNMEFSRYMYQRQQEMNVVATSIQAAFRGKVGRDYVRQLRQRMYDENSAALTLQYFWHHLKRKLRRWNFELLSIAAAKLQSVRRRQRGSEEAYHWRTQVYREQRAQEIKEIGENEWALVMEGAALTVQFWFRKERARVHAPFIRIRRQNVAALMVQALYRGLKGRQYFGRVFEIRTGGAVRIQKYYRYYRRNLAWRSMLKQGIINRLDFNRKKKAMNLSLQNTKKHIETEINRMNNAASLIAKIWRSYWVNESFNREAAARAAHDTKVLEREERREMEAEMRTKAYKIKSALNPKKYPPLPPHPDDHMDEDTRRRILSTRDRVEETKEMWGKVCDRNDLYRRETQKYKLMAQQIRDELPKVAAQVDKFELALMEEIEKTSKFYINSFSPIEVSVFEEENRLQESKNISEHMFKVLGAFDRLDTRRFLLKQAPKIRSLLPFIHIKEFEFYGAIDRTKVIHFQPGDVICAEGDLGDYFYIITDGTVVVTGEDTDGDIVELTRLERNAAFGEMALVNPDGLRTATCVADGFVRTLALHRDRFLKLLSKRSMQVIQYEVEKLKKKFQRQTKEKQKSKEHIEAQRSEDAEQERLARAAQISDAVRNWAEKKKMRHSISRERAALSRRIVKSAITRVKGRIRYRSGVGRTSKDIVRQALEKATRAITLGGIRIGVYDIPELSNIQLDAAMQALRLGDPLKNVPLLELEDNVFAETPAPSARSLGSAFSGLSESDKLIFQTIEYDLMNLKGDDLLLEHELEDVDDELFEDEMEEAELLEDELLQLDDRLSFQEREAEKAEYRAEKRMEREIYCLDDYDWVERPSTAGTSWDRGSWDPSRPSTAEASWPELFVDMHTTPGYGETYQDHGIPPLHFGQQYSSQETIETANFAATEMQKIVRGYLDRRETSVQQQNTLINDQMMSEFAATEVQRVVRGFRGRKRAQKISEDKLAQLEKEVQSELLLLNQDGYSSSEEINI